MTWGRHIRPDGSLDEASLAAALAPQRAQARAMSHVYQALKRGDLQRRPCTQCGAERVHAHHEDYDMPLDVIWLCPLHHAQLHARKRKDAACLLSRRGVGDVRTADAPGTTAARTLPAEQVAADLPHSQPPAPVLAAVLRARLAWERTQPQTFLEFDQQEG